MCHCEIILKIWSKQMKYYNKYCKLQKFNLIRQPYRFITIFTQCLNSNVSLSQYFLKERMNIKLEKTCVKFMVSVLNFYKFNHLSLIIWDSMRCLNISTILISFGRAIHLFIRSFQNSLRDITFIKMIM